MSPHPGSVVRPFDEQSASLRHGAKALIVRAGRVLLIQERHADGTPFWTLPGGGIDPDESAIEALRRELREEIRCDGTPGDAVDRFVYAHTSTPAVTHYRVFAWSLSDPVDPAITEGIFDSRWVPPDGLPPYTLPQVRSVIQSQLRSTGE